ncbi:putative cytokinetic ring protein SteA [Aeromicrobium sp. 9AM]|uniref:putative cytokinetic ring protein SteA n=1 Tax=Aeromicrobium sp. 9AM TaxID=2653126 RepID=UPI00135AD0DC|nr:putative cytokinetic ring protein SteA [Aeromicrobium sp. 9AM]
MTGVVGTVRFARRDSDVASLREGDIAVVDHPELDSRQAQELIDRRVRAVLNAARSSSGRVPNVGPQMLSHAGILLVDIASDAVWSKLKNGERVRIEDGKILRDEILVVAGTELDESRTATALADAESGLATRLDSLAANATDHIQREQTMLLDGARVPRIRTKLRGRAVVVVSKAYDDEADLRGLRRYIRDDDPVLIGAGAGADVLLKAGYVPAIVVGHLDNLSDAAIRAAGEVVVTTSSGTVDTPERLERHGKEVVTFVSTGADDDLAIVLADTNEAAVIVHVGAPATLSKFLERPPSEVARMFVARLRAGSKIVDAKAVNHFTSQRFAMWPVLLLLAAGVAAVAVAIAVTPVGNDWFDSLGDRLADLGTWIKGLFS